MATDMEGLRIANPSPCANSPSARRAGMSRRQGVGVRCVTQDSKLETSSKASRPTWSPCRAVDKRASPTTPNRAVGVFRFRFAVSEQVGDAAGYGRWLAAIQRPRAPERARMGEVFGQMRGREWGERLAGREERSGGGSGKEESEGGAVSGLGGEGRDEDSCWTAWTGHIVTVACAKVVPLVLSR